MTVTHWSPIQQVCKLNDQKFHLPAMVIKKTVDWKCCQKEASLFIVR